RLAPTLMSSLPLHYALPIYSSGVPYQRASLGHTEAHIGFEPAEVRSRQRSHFIMRSISPTTLGTPNGQASTQFEQAMHRGFSADWTTPSSFCLMTSAGHTSAQVGSVQCMQTVGAVWRDPSGPASTSSRWIIDRPRWVPHSSHACTQARQPMQRLWSITNTASSLTSPSLPPARAARRRP